MPFCLFHQIRVMHLLHTTCQDTPNQMSDNEGGSTTGQVLDGSEAREPLDAIDENLDVIITRATEEISQAKRIHKRFLKMEADLNDMKAAVLKTQENWTHVLATIRKIKKSRANAIRMVLNHRQAPPTVHAAKREMSKEQVDSTKRMGLDELKDTIKRTLDEMHGLFKMKKKFIAEGNKVTPMTHSIMKMVEDEDRADVDLIECEKVARNRLEKIKAYCTVLNGNCKR